MEKINRGSVWNTWDLHVHTPGTKLNDNFKDSRGLKHTQENNKIWEEYCEALNESQNLCFGITDYFSIDGYKYLVENRDKLGLRKDIVLFPNIELRASGLVPKNKKTSHNHVNIHILFSEKTPIEKLQRFLRSLTVTGDDGVEKNYDEDIGELVSQNGFRQVPVYTNIHEALKKIFGVHYKDKSLIIIPNGDDGLSRNEGTNSDNNLNFMKNDVDIIQSTSSRDREFHLKQAFNYYGKRYPCVSGSDAHSIEDIKNYDKKKTTWIKGERSFEGLKSILYEPEYRVSIQENPPFKVSTSKIINSLEFHHEHFGPKKLYFNEDINVIIGGRSSGKSLLLSLLGRKSGGVIKVKSDSVDYEEMVNDYAKHSIIRLQDETEVSEDMILEYFYQDKLQEIARNNVKRNRFINEVLGSNQSIQEKYEQIQLNKSILSKLITEYDNLNLELNELFEENVRIQSEELLRNNILEIEEEKKKISIELNDEELLKIEKINKEQEVILQKKSICDSRIKILEKLEKQQIVGINDFIDDSDKEMLLEIVPNLTIQLTELNKKIKHSVDGEKEKSIQQAEKFNERIDEIYNQDIMKKYLKAAANLPQLDVLDSKIKSEKKLLEIKEKLIEKINELTSELNGKMIEIINYLNGEFYTEKINIHDGDELKISLNTSANMEVIGSIFKEQLLTHQKTFRESVAVNSFKKIRDIGELSEIKELSMEDFKATLNNIHLNRFEVIFKANTSIITLLRRLMELEYINIDFDIKYEKDDFSRMSEGKKAFVLLLIKLQLGDENCPLLIDQPEDNLDNRSIVNNVVEYFKNEKVKRQLFIVTHNANVVVATDSENVIIANEHDVMNPNPNEVKYYYKNGSLEDLKIKEEVCDILEGGKEAFKAREYRYNFV